MNKEAVYTDTATKPLGAYSQAIKAHNMLFIAGQIPLNPATGAIEGKTVSEQARLVLKHIGAVLKASGLTFGDVVKADVFLTNIGDSKAVNEVYSEFFSNDPKPARVTVEVSKLPLGSMVEISCIAVFSKEASQ
jgi:2-iminobutanoate/2-iminopropanoate deaminase